MATTDDDRTREELREELRERGLPVSGTKRELAERLRSAEEDSAEEGSAEEGGAEEGTAEEGGDRPTGGDERVDALSAARRAASYLEKLLGQPAERLIGVSRDDDGRWHIAVEVVELARIPPTTDVLAAYEVVLDADGALRGYEQRRRYTRGQVGEVGS